MGALLRAVEDEDESFDSGSFEADDTPLIAGRYELLDRLSRGATGSIYRAYDHTLVREVAVKLLEPGELAVAEREARILAKVAHRNVVTVHDVGRGFGPGAGGSYIVLELLHGRDISHWLQGGPASAETLERLLDAGRGLSAAHQAGLAHRDFKPRNVMVTTEGRVVVINFGLGHRVRGGPDALGSELGPQRWRELEPGRSSAGTLEYMAPERIAGRDNDERSDQFSFCVVLWEALTGANPFTGAAPLPRYRSIQHGPRGSRPSAPQQLVSALARGLSFEPSHRFETMAELIHELERPAPLRRRRHVRPVLMTAAVAATFACGWGFVPESATLGEATSPRDPAPPSADDGESARAKSGHAAKLICAARSIHTASAVGTDSCAPRGPNR
ncbi:Serine/threonine-protein kinase PknB [Enhygromyxa salina]|uniref:Serine/threonine-protein kinase PknB n=1 Tax=Enhygromyxa salina TaxID=215803 RepID=A0A2S9YK82_9BACT|nr:serine/threonine-protein kinase [Enhygromyxa salina]PRQ05436.1 Serine/threonine-protein kinase PknB [Enhygromyxa salina]